MIKSLRKMFKQKQFVPKRNINLLIFIFFFFNLILPIPTHALNKSVLVDCSQSTSFTKRKNTSIKKLENRLAKYEKGSLPAIAIQEQIKKTENRFQRYSDSGLLCGTDGLPHLIADGDLKHLNEFVTPGIMFIYIAGWIGWSGRKYIQEVSKQKNPTQKEIILDVPLALRIMFSAYLWPYLSWQEFLANNFVEKNTDITVSPR